MTDQVCTNCGLYSDGTFTVANEYGCQGTEGIECPHGSTAEDGSHIKEFYCKDIPHEDWYITPHDYVPFEEYANLCSTGDCACQPVEWECLNCGADNEYGENGETYPCRDCEDEDDYMSDAEYRRDQAERSGNSSANWGFTVGP